MYYMPKKVSTIYQSGTSVLGLNILNSNAL